LAGDSPEVAATNADTVLRIETQLAQSARTPTQLRDDEANYNKKSTTELAALAPNLPWPVFFKSVTGADADFADVIIGQPEFVENLNTMLGSVSMADWRTYLRWHLLHSAAPFLSEPFETENFRFYSQTMRGAKEMEPRWKRALHTLDREMGEALGRLYVEKYFSPAAKKRVSELVRNLLDAYKERLETREWMSPETRKLALEKLATITPKLAYPDKWRDYTTLDVQPDAYVLNVFRAHDFELRFWLAKLHQPVDHTLWSMTPPTVNAYYNPTLNEIVFPAGILQPPFFYATADDAVNYGSIGAVIGHEITHGFDDQGSRFDHAGNLKNWWTPEDRARFTAKTDALVKQYSDCTPLPDLHVNGRLTLGENIADLGGLTIAYYAYLKSLHGQPAPIIDNLTGPQRFFIGYAYSWCGSSRDAQLRFQLRTDPHSPPEFRTLVPLWNFAPFYDAFNVQPTDKMFRPPEQRVEIW
jgi:putative endopeptidase